MIINVTILKLKWVNKRLDFLKLVDKKCLDGPKLNLANAIEARCWEIQINEQKIQKRKSWFKLS